jgi:hypothetical protein
MGKRVIALARVQAVCIWCASGPAGRKLCCASRAKGQKNMSDENDETTIDDVLAAVQGPHRGR